MTISVVGLHAGEVFGRRAREAIAAADVVVASARHQRFVEMRAAQTSIEMSGPLHGVLDQVAEATARQHSVVVLSSGDPGFFGIVRMLGERFGTDQIEVHPAPSSIAIAFGRIGLNWDDAVIVSAHGRPPNAAIEAVRRFAKVAVLTSPQTPPELIGSLALQARCAPRSVAVATRLGEPGESVTITDLAGLAAGTYDPMSVVILLDTASDRAQDADTTFDWGIAEQEFVHRGGLITKSEVRAVALGKLALPIGGVLWDVGAGSGSVGIECARVAPRLRVIAVERNDDDAQRIRSNAQQHGVAVEVVVGAAPDALAGLPHPDRVFVGGGGMDVAGACFDALRPGGVMVCTHVLVARAAEAYALLGNSVQISASRAVPIADGFRLEAQNPVFISWGTKE